MKHRAIDGWEPPRARRHERSSNWKRRGLRSSSIRSFGPITPDGDPFLIAKLHLEPGPGAATAISGGLVFRDQPLVASPLDLRPRREAVRRQAARREEQVVVGDQALEDFSPCPEGVLAQIAPAGLDTIKGDVDWWRHHGGR